MTTTVDSGHQWWSELRQDGLLIAPTVLDEIFPGGPSAVSELTYGRLRDRQAAFATWWSREGAEGNAVPLHAWLDEALEGLLGYAPERWRKGARVEERFAAATPLGERLRADRVLLGKDSDQGALLVRVDRSRRLGLGRGRTAYAKLLTLLRAGSVKLGLLTNGAQFRLVYAGLDHDAWVEWDTEAWFAGAETRAQLHGFCTLLGSRGCDARDGMELPLLHAVESSRTRQGELSQVLGEQVRRAVETLLHDLDQALRRSPELADTMRIDPVSRQPVADTERLQALYQATTRLVMRLVVALFAEARELLPRSLEVYHSSYGVESLFAALSRAERQEGGRALENQHGAWQRLLALFRLICFGSQHPDLSVTRYGGTLFRPGDPASPDAVLRALSVLEGEHCEISDWTVLQVLRLLKIGRVKVRRGRTSTWVGGPVDFSDLRTEYIGIMYEGLLDYELRQVSAEQGPVVFLALGQEPVLPLDLLESLPDKDLKNLLTSLAKGKDEGSLPDAGADVEPEDATSHTGETPAPAEPALLAVAEVAAALAPELVAENSDTPTDESGADEPTDVSSDENDLRRRALAWAERAVEVAGLIRRPRGGRADPYTYQRERATAARGILRRILGVGEFYLARWGGLRKGSGTFYTRPQLAVPLTQRTLKPLCYEPAADGGQRPAPPEKLLNLKVCDPAMGSGSFLVAALRYITEALYDSLHLHGRIRPAPSAANTVVALPFARPATGEPGEELLPVPPDDDRFEPMLKARLKRHVVERCIYGVDINPMAVELARLSLWVETMDRDLPFEFLDHKLKVGNSLVGCWFDRFQHYPVKAWERDGGDRQHNGVNVAKGEISRWIREVHNKTIKPQLKLLGNAAAGQMRWEETGAVVSPVSVQERHRALVEQMHNLPREEREEFYQKLQHDDDFAQLKAAFDRWCCVWFWPNGTDARPPALLDFASPTPQQAAVVQDLANQHRFFHWELEFPDVFTRDRAGFDAVLGNPPWDILKPNSIEFFSRYDPTYRAYAKQEALTQQRRIFAGHPASETEWLHTSAYFRAMSNWVTNAADPLETTVPDKGYAHPNVPFRHQGSADLNTYKLFLETSHHLLRDAGRLGMIAPAGLYSDKGSSGLRKLFLENCRWELLLALVNERFIFPGVDHRFRFALAVLQRDGNTDDLQTGFRVTIQDALRVDQVPPLLMGDTDSLVPLTVQSVRRFSPESLTFLTFRSKRDLEILDKIYGNRPLLGDVLPTMGAQFATEFHMTGDSGLFVPRQRLEEQGILAHGADVRDQSVRAALRVAGYLPLYEGKHINQFDPYYSGDYRYFIPVSMKRTTGWDHVVWREIGRATDTRTLISARVRNAAFNHKLWTISGLKDKLADRVTALLNSFVLDFVVRSSIGGATLGLFVVAGLPLPDLLQPSDTWQLVDTHVSALESGVGDPDERKAARCVIDALVAHLYHLNQADFTQILGAFPAVDKHLAPAQRQTSLTLAVFQEGLIR